MDSFIFFPAFSFKLGLNEADAFDSSFYVSSSYFNASYTFFLSLDFYLSLLLLAKLIALFVGGGLRLF